MLNEGGTEQEIRKDLETVSAAWERAIVSNDAGAIGQFMTDDWVIVSATGITKKSDFLAAVASGDLTHESFKGNIVSVRGYGDTGVDNRRFCKTRRPMEMCPQPHNGRKRVTVDSNGEFKFTSRLTSVMAIFQQLCPLYCPRLRFRGWEFETQP